jgi:prophage regulatory protein
LNGDIQETLGGAMSNQLDRILKLPDVIQTVGLKRSRLYTLISTGDFPPPVRLSTRAVGWRASSIQEWIESRALATEARFVRGRAARVLRGESSDVT